MFFFVVFFKQLINIQHLLAMYKSLQCLNKVDWKATQQDPTPASPLYSFKDSTNSTFSLTKPASQCLTLCRGGAGNTKTACHCFPPLIVQSWLPLDWLSTALSSQSRKEGYIHRQQCLVDDAEMHLRRQGLKLCRVFDLSEE